MRNVKMSEKKTNDIIEEQRKARQEFINLKKMQQGEMYAGPKPSETATVLKTPWQKFQNFWSYSKWVVLSAIAITVLIAVMVVQCATRPVYDLKVVYFTYTPVLDDQTTAISDYIAEYTEDVNGDGEVNIQVVNCSVSQESSNITMRNATLQKLQAMIVAEENALLFITDEDSAAYFDGLSDEVGGFFEETEVKLGEDFYAATENETLGRLSEGLTLSCRRVVGTIIEGKEDIVAYRNAAVNIIKNIIEAQSNN